MEAINHSLFHNNNLTNLLAQTSQGGLNPQYGVNTRTKAKAELQITTAEGDRVTLFSESKTRTAFASYDSAGRSAGAESSGTMNTYQIVTTNKVAIAVEGNLNEEELADIQRLLQSVEDMFTSYLSEDGTIDEDMASSLSLDSMKTLSHFDAELKYSQKIEGFGVVSGNTGQLPGSTASGESASSETGLVPEASVDATPDMTTLTAFKAKTKASLHISGTRLTMAEPVQTLSREILPEAGTPGMESGSGSTAAATNLPSDTGSTVTDPAMNSVSMINLEASLKTSIRIKVAQSLLNTAQAASGPPEEPSAPVQNPADGTSAPVSTDGTTTPVQAADTSSANPDTASSISASRLKLVEEFAALIRQSPVDMNRMSSVFDQFIPGLMEQLNNTYVTDESQKEEITQMGEDILNTFQSSPPELIQ